MDDLAPFYQACDPIRQIGSGEYVDLDRLRGIEISLGEVITRTLRLTGHTKRFLLSGYPGTGKSTEISRVSQMLRDEQYLVVNVPTEAFLFERKLEASDLLQALLVALNEALGESVGRKIQVKEPTLLDTFKSYLHALNPKLGIQEVSLSALGNGIKLKALEQGGDALAEVREALRGKTKSLFELTSEVLRQAQEQLPSAYKGLYLIVDNLEKAVGVQDPKEAARLFLDAPFYSLPCHLLLTIPLSFAISFAPRLQSAYNCNPFFLPLVRLAGPPPDRQVDEGGVRSLRRVLELRTPDHKLSKWMAPAAARKLILGSAGDVRELMRLTGEAIMSRKPGSSKVSAADAELVLKVQTRTLTTSVSNPEQWKILAHVAAHSGIDVDLDFENPDVLYVLNNKLLVHYFNGASWYRVHPLVEQSSLFQARLQRDSLM